MSVEKELLPSPCPINCPNRKTTLGKGYAYLFSLTLTALLLWQSVDLKYSRQGLELQTKPIPTYLITGFVLLIGGALGLNTDGLANALGIALSSGRKID
jgi:transketolase